MPLFFRLHSLKIHTNPAIRHCVPTKCGREAEVKFFTQKKNVNKAVNEQESLSSFIASIFTFSQHRCKTLSHLIYGNTLHFRWLITLQLFCRQTFKAQKKCVKYWVKKFSLFSKVCSGLFLGYTKNETILVSIYIILSRQHHHRQPNREKNFNFGQIYAWTMFN